MRILIATPLVPPEPGGPSYYCVGVQGALERAGHTVDVVSFSRIRRWPSGVRHVLYLYHVLWAARGANLILILDTVSVALPAVIAGWVLGKRTIVRTGGDFVWEHYVERTGELVPLSTFYIQERLLSGAERRLVLLQRAVVFRLASTVAFSTAWQRELWREPYSLALEKTMVVENARPVSVYAQQTSQQVATCTFVWVGRDKVLKNVELLKEAFTRVHTQHPDSALSLLTNVPQEEALAAVAKARCVVVPSVSEVSPNIVFEALSLGVPVICTQDTGIREACSDVVSFVDTRDVDALTQAMLSMCDNREHAVWCGRIAGWTYERTYDDVARELTSGITSNTS